MGLIGEFKEFIIKGNAIDLAVGIIIGAAFGAVVTSLVTDVIMPPIGAAMGGVDFSKLGFTVLSAVKAGEKHPVTQLVMDKDIPAVVIAYGKFLNAVIALLIQGFAVFMIVKVINRLKKAPAPAPAMPPAPAADVVLLSEIRDLLKQGR
jgi:large conductance mechanosensitive channel